MSLDTAIWQAQLHRETYVGILNSVLRRRGSKKSIGRESRGHTAVPQLYPRSGQ
jgi:hypothetical protein